MRLSLPPPPERSSATPFPVLGVLAPLLAAGVLFAVTRSPYVLIFAALSPVVAIAGVIDSRVSTRRRRRLARAAEQRWVEELRREVGRSHEAQRVARLAATPNARSIVDGSAPDSLLWRAASRGERSLVLGLGSVPSGIAVDGVAGSVATRRLVAEAAVLRDAPVLVPCAAGVGVCGSPVLAAAVLRGLILQFAFLSHPADARIRVRPGGEEWSWIERLPHWDPAAPAVGTDRGGAHDCAAVCLVVANVGGADVVLAAAPAASDLPPDCTTVFFVAGTREARVLAGECSSGSGDEVLPECVSAAECEAAACALGDRGARVLSGGGSRALPERVNLADLVDLRGTGPGSPDDSGAPDVATDVAIHSPRAGRPRALRATVGLTPVGPLDIDLIADGPHAVIGGTTGSGKSELLLSWVVSLAAGASPAELTFLLVDFKGGASFDSVVGLPHCVGLVTDLDSGSARRALDSLRAELRFRERRLRECGIRDVADADSGLARLVIVVDEFAAMLVDFPELHDVFVDIASRGRSLGVHLILCTQRPAGAVRDSLLANCNLRLSLRVNSRADSLAVIGTDHAASLPPRTAGRCLVSVGGEAPLLAQIATLSPAELGSFVTRCAETGGPEARRPWLDPLPAVLTLADLEDPMVDRSGVRNGIVFGLVDVPTEQRRRYATWDPREDGHLLVLGAHLSGKSNLVEMLATVGAGAGQDATRMEIVRPEPDEAWDAVSQALDSIRSRADAPKRILLLDDVDAVVARFDADYAPAFSDMLSAVAREGPACGVRLVLTAQRLAGVLSALAPLIGRTVLLRLANRQEHVLAGGDVTVFDDTLLPGGGWWRGHRLQVARVAGGRSPGGAADQNAPGGELPAGRVRTGRRVAGGRAAPVLTLRTGRSYAIVTTRPTVVSGLLTAAARDVPVDVTFLAEVPPASGRSGMQTRSDPPGVVAAPLPDIDVIVGDPDEWQASWPALTAARRGRYVVYDGCVLRDYRAISRSRDLPPPLPANGRGVWFTPPGGRVERREWPD